MNHPVRDKRIVLKRKEEKRILAGHPWVFSNQIDVIEGDPVSGDLVSVYSHGSAPVGTAFFNPFSLITCRIVDRSDGCEVDAEFFRKRILHAHALRNRLFPGEESFRLVHGEADYLPGLIIDKYNDYLSVQTLSFGMDLRLPLIADALEDLFSPTGIVERNESPLRGLEQLPARKTLLRGTCGETTISLAGVQFRMNPLEGQKTGFYLDQRENRRFVGAIARGAAVLDCFCNDGGFGLTAAAGGAASVHCIDSSPEAIGRTRENAALNGFSNVTAAEGDVFDHLKELIRAERTFDLVILDPPSFTRSKKNVQAAKKGYRDLHGFALRVLKPGGILATASCSHHIRQETFLESITRAADRTERRLQQLAWLGASPDHPTLPDVPETMYLKFGLFRAD